MTDSAFFDCSVSKLGTQDFVFGGAFSIARSTGSFSDVLVARGAALGASPPLCPQGGGGSVRDNAILTMNDVLFSGNSTTCAGGADDVQLITGGTLQETDVRYYGATSTGPVDGKLIAAPSQRVAATARTTPETWLIHGWSGASAELDGVSQGLTPRNARVAGGAGSHSLVVDPGGFVSGDGVVAGATPVTTLSVDPACPSSSSTLSWSTPAGELLAAFTDQGIAGSGGAGSTSVAPAGTTTYRRVVLTRQGGASAAATVYVGICPLVFADGFDLGDTGAWSLTIP
jgi:hypothetical protein